MKNKYIIFIFMSVICILTYDRISLESWPNFSLFHSKYLLYATTGAILTLSVLIRSLKFFSLYFLIFTLLNIFSFSNAQNHLSDWKIKPCEERTLISCALKNPNSDIPGSIIYYFFRNIVNKKQFIILENDFLNENFLAGISEIKPIENTKKYSIPSDYKLKNSIEFTLILKQRDCHLYKNSQNTEVATFCAIKQNELENLNKPHKLNILEPTGDGTFIYWFEGNESFLQEITY